MWTWLGTSPSGQTWSYLIRVSLWLANRPNLVGYWKFYTSLLEKEDFQKQLETVIQQAIVGEFTENK